jgi:outer membrane lipoprotein carrier protein
LIKTIAALSIVTIALPVIGDEVPDSGTGKALVREFLTDVSTLASRFEQTLVDANGEVLEVSSGTLEIKRPGQFRWAYDRPYEQWLVADGLNIWSYDLDLAQVTVKPQAQALANTPALLLAGSTSAMNEFEYDGSFEDGGLTWVRMRPVNTDSGFRRLELAFSDRILTRMVFFDNLEQTTRVSLSNVVINESIDPAQFRFVAPDGVDIVGTPATPALSASEMP